MSLQKLQLRPGVNREATTYANEGGWYASDKARFRSGFPEKIGGWVRYSAYAFVGVCRNMWNWIALNGTNLLGVGTNQKYYVENGGQFYDITPLRNTTIITLGANPISVTNGSKKVLITASGHGATAGSYVTFSGATAVGGITVSGEYEIIEVPDGNSYYIASPTAATSTATGGGSAVGVYYQLNAGNSVYTSGVGWGAGAWSRGTWGSGTTVGVGQQLSLWGSDNFGQDLVIVPRLGAPYYWAVDTATYPRALTLASVATTNGYSGSFVPTSTFKMVTSDVQRFGIALGSNPYDPLDANTAFDPLLVRWSDQENVYDWVPTDTNQAGEQRLSQGSGIITGQHTRQEGLIWTDSGLYSMQYLGPPYVWGFQLLMDNISIISPNAAVTVNSVTYWMGIDKFYVYSGRVETLPCTLRQFIFTNLNVSQAYQIVCGTNEGYNEIWWFYPSANSVVNDSYVIYNHLERIWYYGTINRTAWLDSSLKQYPLGSFSVQTSYLGTDISSSVTSITLVNASSYPASGTITIESEQITYTGITGNTLTGCTRGANLTTAASHLTYTPVTHSVGNQVIYHENGVDDGTVNPAIAIESYIESSDFDIGDGHNFGFVWRILPDVTFNGSVSTNPQLMLTVLPRQNSGSNYSAADSPTVTRTATYPVEQYTGQVYTRVRGRQMAFMVSSTELGTTWQLGSPRLDIRPDGRR
jgi:hypothetical protein